MNRFAKATCGITISVMILLSASVCRADEASRRPRQMENRFLFIIDTGSSMRFRTNGVEQAIAGLLQSDMRGEFRKGDTVGVWTYDDQIHADFPMQVWSEENKSTITGDVMRFVRHQHYEKRGRLGKVLDAIGRVMQQSDRLTVVLIYDGTELIRGTQFDTDINDLQKHYARQFRSAHLPMVTVLAARLGQVFDYTINYPGAITIPHTATALPPPETNAPPAIVAVATPPPTNAVPAEPAPPPRRIEIVMSGTNSVTRTMTDAESKANEPSSRPNNIVMVATPRSQPPVEAAAPAPLTVEPVTASPPPSAPKPEPPVSEPPPVAAQPEPAPVISSAPAKTQPTPAPLPNPATAAVPAPTPSTAPVTGPSPATVESPAPVRSPAPVASLTAAPVPVPAPVPLAVASPGQQLALFVIAFSLLTIAVVLVVFLIRRSRGDGPPSLISQSIDRSR